MVTVLHAKLVTPQLAQAYKDSPKAGNGVVIVFVSSDEDETNQALDTDADLAAETDQSAEATDEAPVPEAGQEEAQKGELKD